MPGGGQAVGFGGCREGQDRTHVRPEVIVVVGDGVRDRLGDAVIPLPVTDLPATTVVLAWPQDTIDPRTAAFVTTATERLDAGQVAAAS